MLIPGSSAFERNQPFVASLGQSKLLPLLPVPTSLPLPLPSLAMPHSSYLRNYSAVSQTPARPFEKERLDEELKVCGEYGLRAKKELWRINRKLSHVRKAARVLLTLEEKDPRRLFEGTALLRRLTNMGLLDETKQKLDYILELKADDFLERRLQTIVWKLDMAKSIHHARVLIRQRHIRCAAEPAPRATPRAGRAAAAAQQWAPSGGTATAPGRARQRAHRAAVRGARPTRVAGRRAARPATTPRQRQCRAGAGQRALRDQAARNARSPLQRRLYIAARASPSQRRPPDR